VQPQTLPTALVASAVADWIAVCPAPDDLDGLCGAPVYRFTDLSPQEQMTQMLSLDRQCLTFVKDASRLKTASSADRRTTREQ
jgi:hypothetical protein